MSILATVSLFTLQKTRIVTAPPIYECSRNGPLRQGEIISGLVQIQLATGTEREFPSEDAEIPIRRIEFPYAIVISQDCDLDWDFKHRKEPSTFLDKVMPNTLFCELYPAEELRHRPGGSINSGIWSRIRTNKDERYHFLQRVEVGDDAISEGLPELALDFKRCFSIPTDELYLQFVSQAKRRCRIVSPYLEHLAVRVFYYHSRVALPADHISE